MLESTEANDRVFLYIRAGGAENPRAEWIPQLKLDGYPVLELNLPPKSPQPASLLTLMYGLEKTVATIGWLWDINIVDQFAVEGYKANARAIKAAGMPRPQSRHQARFGALELQFDALIEQGLMTEQALTDALAAIHGDRDNAADVYAAIVKHLGGRPGLYKDFRYYGQPTLRLRRLIEGFRGVFSRTFHRVTQFGIGPDVNHKRHQHDADGTDEGLLTLIFAWEHEQPAAGTYSDEALRAMALGTRQDLEKRGRPVLFLLLDRLTPETEAALAD